MSEFECRNGHLPAPSTIRLNHCPCGARIIRMDGMSGRELKEMEREWDREMEREEGGEEE